MIPISVVIIAKNEAHIIGRTIQSVNHFTDDVIIVDSGSTDATKEIARLNNAKVIETNWDGFGQNKNKGIKAAKYNWILSIDADEIPDAELLKSISGINLENAGKLYQINFQTFLGNKRIRYGEWGKDAHVRLFNRTKVTWNGAAVHEQLLIPKDSVIEKLPGYILHYTMKDLADYATKMNNYALLNADHYFNRGKRSTWLKRNFSHHFSFVSNYIFKLGFMDGIHGYWIAKMTSHYTFLKYARLFELQGNK
jgi:glycosyltransferase involved in cell wall biosynthesis